MGIPRYPKEMASEWQKTQRDIKSLFTSANVRKALSQVSTGTLEILGTLTIKPGGKFNAEYTNGNSAVYVGTVSDGNVQGEGVVLRRGDGTEVLVLEGFSDEDSTFAIKDLNEAIIFADDEQGGLAQPYLPYTFVDTVNMPSTVSGTYETIATAWIHKQHPMIRIAYYQTTTSTTGQIKFIVSGGTADGTELVVIDTTTGSTTGIEGPITLPGDFLENFFIEVQARVDTGVGDVGCVVLGAYGVKSE